MARAQKPPAGRLIVSIIYAGMDGLSDALRLLERQFGPIQCETMEIPYQEEAYTEEMGPALERRFYSFEKSVNRDRLPELKAICGKIERQFGDPVDDFTFRTVNIDPGIATPDNVIMASNREYNHRVYLTNGVYAELALVYSRDHYVRLPWTSPAFLQEEAIEFFLRVRATFDPVASTAVSEAS